MTPQGIRLAEHGDKSAPDPPAALLHGSELPMGPDPGRRAKPGRHKLVDVPPVPRRMAGRTRTPSADGDPSRGAASTRCGRSWFACGRGTRGSVAGAGGLAGRCVSWSSRPGDEPPGRNRDRSDRTKRCQRPGGRSKGSWRLRRRLHCGRQRRVVDSPPLVAARPGVFHTCGKTCGNPQVSASRAAKPQQTLEFRGETRTRSPEKCP